jgi:hypothetical protein
METRRHPTRWNPWTRDEALDAGKTYLATHGVTPNAHALSHGLRASGLPSRQAVLKLFGTLAAWDRAVLGADVPLPPPPVPSKVFRCLCCGQARKELAIHRRICGRCKHRTYKIEQ